MTHCTFTQGYWGNNGGHGQAESRIALITRLIGNDPIIVGADGRTLTIPADKAECIVRRLPAGGPSVALTSGAHAFGNDCATDLPLDNKSMKFRNNLLGQTISMALNVRYDTTLAGMPIGTSFTVWSSSGKSCQTYTLPASVLTALDNLGLPKTVGGLLALANLGLGGQPTGGASLTDIGGAISTINGAFDECRIWVQYGGCPR